MTMTDIVDLEEAFTKSGAELFKELYRIYPVADPEDYFKQGQWKNEVMKTDLMLIESHRRESGAPDVPDLEDVKAPQLPQPVGYPGYSPTAAMVSAGFFGAQGTLKPAGVGITPTLPVGGSLGTAVGNSSPVVEIRLIALFVAKWKLDPVTAKTLLAKLTPTRRRYVIQNFKTTITGVEATKELGDYIATCEIDGSWDTAPAAANGTPVPGPAPTTAGLAGIAAAKAHVGPRPITPRPVAVGATVGVAGGTVVAPNPAVSGLKRPLNPVAANPAWQMNKRPNLLQPGVIRPPGFARPPFGKGAW